MTAAPKGLTLLYIQQNLLCRRFTSLERKEIQSDSSHWSRHTQAWNLCLVPSRCNIGSFPACTSEPPNFTPVQVILHRRDCRDFHMHYLQRKRGGVGWGRAGLSKHSLPQVIIQKSESSPVDEMCSCLCTWRGLHIQTVPPLFHFNAV